MINHLSRAIVGACLLAAAAQPSGAATIFSNDFTTGVGPQDEVTGNFTVGEGYLGHHNGYTNNEASSYRILLDLAGVTDAFLDFDYWINSENIFDGAQVTANGASLGGYTGNGAGHAHFSLAPLTQPGVTGSSTVAISFYSNAAITAGGFQLDNVAVTGNVANAPVSGVPEPASWAMTVAGFGALGATMRQRRREPSPAVL